MQTPSGDRVGLPVSVGRFRIPVDKSLNVEGNRAVGNVLDDRAVVADRRGWSAVSFGHPVLVEFYMEMAAGSAYREHVPCAVTEGASTVAPPTVHRVVICRTVLVPVIGGRSEEHTSELQSRFDLVCRLLLEK